MPLHAEQERSGLALDRLHDAALVLRDDPQASPEPVDGLVMKRIHQAGIAAQDPVEARLPRSMDTVLRGSTVRIFGACT